MILQDTFRIHSAEPYDISRPTTLAEIQETVSQSQIDGKPIAIMGMRNNLGGHAFSNNARVLDMRQYSAVLECDPETRRIRVQSGITWHDLQGIIHPLGLAVGTMQSSSRFTIGGSLAANIHGQDIHRSHLISSVRSMRILTSQNQVLSVSREDNPELFRWVIGGYGLLGIVIDCELELVPNNLYVFYSRLQDTSSIPSFVHEHLLKDPDNSLFLGQLSITPQNLLGKCIAKVWKQQSWERTTDGTLLDETHVIRDRFLIRLSRRFDWGKNLRWSIEKSITKSAQGRVMHRNAIMRPPVNAQKRLEHTSPHYTEVVEEFVLPIPEYIHFIGNLRALLKQWHINLLGASTRYLTGDQESALAYAPVPSLSIMLFMSFRFTPQGINGIDSFTKAATEKALAHGGRYYLAYHRACQNEFITSVYPNITELPTIKETYDPQGLFRSRFYETIQDHVARK